MGYKDYVVAFIAITSVVFIILYSAYGQVVPAGKTYEVQLDEEIGDPKSVRKTVDIFRNSKKGDIINVHISGPGGQVDTTFLLINAIRASKAHVRMIVEAPSYSGDAYIATQGSELIMMPYSYLMFHTSSGYGYDCSLDTGVDRTVSNKEHCESFMKMHLYEIEKLIESVSILLMEEKISLKYGHDVYISADEYNNRLKGKFKSQAHVPLIDVSKEVLLEISNLRLNTNREF